MTLNDGYEEWRNEEFQSLSNLVQERFKQHENPSNCENATLLTNGDSPVPCGWGCQFVFYADTFVSSLILNRTLVYRKPKSHYYEHDEFQKYCEPLITSCNFSFTEKEITGWPGKVSSKILNNINFRKDVAHPDIYVMTSMPAQVFNRFNKLFEEPDIWWMSQILKFITPLRPKYQKMVDDTAKRLGISSPIVGIHVRRGDKKKEIAYQPLEAYMTYVKEYYDILELTRKIVKRRVFIASDDPNIPVEAKKKYPDYEFLFDYEYSTDVQNYEDKNKNPFPIYLEMRLMSMCDCWIGTFSSNIGRRYYYSQYWNHKDALTFSKSLDYHLYENWENVQLYKVVIQHKGINFEALVGDIVQLHDLWDTMGQYLVISQRTKQKGFIPKFKIERIFDTVNMPVFDD